MDRAVVTGWSYFGSPATRRIAKMSAALLPLLVVALGIALTPVPSGVHDPVPAAERVSASSELWQFQCPEGPAVVRLATPDLLTVESPGLLYLLAARDGTEAGRASRPSAQQVSVPGDPAGTTHKPRVPPGSALDAAMGRPGRTTLRPLGPYAVVRSVPPIEGLPAEQIGDVGIYDALTGAYLLSFGGETSLAFSADRVVYAGSRQGLVSAHRVTDREVPPVTGTMP